MTVGCLKPSSPTCVLPPLGRGTKQHTCGACRRVWRPADDGHGPYWRWDGHTINKKAVTR